ncbi:MAG: radical SAM protein, partial [Bacteroidetes bacterium]|nr:radical SAM protein [Bacteroidota bacterium]
MRKLTVGIIDILGKSTSRKGYSRYMRANFSSVMPQVVAVWCAELGHDVHMCYYDGPEVIAGGLPDDVDIIFMSAFSQTAQLAYALSNFYQTKGAVTVLG